MRPAAAAATEWAGLKGFPLATQASLQALLARAASAGRTSLTLLLLGKPGAGKSATVNSLLGERVAAVSAFGPDPAPTKVTAFGRTAAGFTLTLVDTPGLLDGDAVSGRAVAAVAAFCAATPVDAVLYVDRLDAWRVDSLDAAVLAAITAALGPAVWERAVVVLTHGQMLPPDGIPHPEFAARRADALRAAIRSAAGVGGKGGKGGGGGGPALVCALAENSGRCAVSAAGERVLPGGTPWLPALLGAALDAAQAAKGPLVPPPGAGAGGGGGAPPGASDARGRWAVLPLLALQLLVIRPLMVARMRRDGELGGGD